MTNAAVEAATESEAQEVTEADETLADEYEEEEKEEEEEEDVEQASSINTQIGQNTFPGFGIY